MHRVGRGIHIDRLEASHELNLGRERLGAVFVVAFEERQLQRFHLDSRVLHRRHAPIAKVQQQRRLSLRLLVEVDEEE